MGINLRSESILVTGGAGFVGSHLVNELLKYGNRVIVVDNLSLGKKENLPKTDNLFKFVHANASFSVLNDVIQKEKIDTVFNLAVIPLPASFKDPSYTFHTNVEITRSLCDLLLNGKYNRLIHFSSSEAYGSAAYLPMDEKHPLNATTPYAASKAASDLLILSYCKTFDINAVILRPFNIYGPRQNAGQYAAITPKVIMNILNDKEIVITGDGKQSRDFTYVSDVVSAAILLYSHDNLRNIILNIGSGINYSMNSWVDKILAICEKKILVSYNKQRLADVMCHKADIRLAHKLIGYKPVINSQNGLSKTIEWYIKKEKYNE